MGLVLTVVLLGGGSCDKIGKECDLFSSGGVSYLQGGLTRKSSAPSFSPTCELSYPVVEQCIRRPSEDSASSILDCSPDQCRTNLFFLSYPVSGILL